MNRLVARRVRVGDLIDVGDRLGVCRLYSIESCHTFVVEKEGRYYRVSGGAYPLASDRRVP